MLADSEPQEECDQSWSHGRQGQTEMGGVKQVSNPHVRKNDNICLPLWHGMLLPSIRNDKYEKQRIQNQQPEHKDMLFQEMGGEAG